MNDVNSKDVKRPERETIASIHLNDFNRLNEKMRGLNADLENSLVLLLARKKKCLQKKEILTGHLKAFQIFSTKRLFRMLLHWSIMSR